MLLSQTQIIHYLYIQKIYTSLFIVTVCVFSDTFYPVHIIDLCYNAEHSASVHAWEETGTTSTSYALDCTKAVEEQRVAVNIQ